MFLENMHIPTFLSGLWWEDWYHLPPLLAFMESVMYFFYCHFMLHYIWNYSYCGVMLSLFKMNFRIWNVTVLSHVSVPSTMTWYNITVVEKNLYLMLLSMKGWFRKSLLFMLIWLLIHISPSSLYCTSTQSKFPNLTKRSFDCHPFLFVF